MVKYNNCENILKLKRRKEENWKEEAEYDNGVEKTTANTTFVTKRIRRRQSALALCISMLLF